MSLSARMGRLLGSRDPAAIDPDTPVVVAEVPLHEGPLLVSALEGAGIKAIGYEAAGRWVRSLAWNRMRVLVRAGDVEAANDLIAKLRST